MDKKIVKWDKTGIEKQKFNEHQNPILIYDVEINRILLSTKD